MNAEETNKENSSTEPLIERKPIQGTPFWMIRTEGEYWITMGAYKLNQQALHSQDEVEEFLIINTYNITLMMIEIHTNIKHNLKTKQ